MTDDGYIFNRGYSSSTRLALQHYIWRETLGFNIHPDIPAPGPNACIADVATGNGVWLLDVARQLPTSVQLEGSDVDLAQCPPPQWLPSNAKLQEWSVYDEPPPEMVGKYDIVHVRLIGVVIKDDKPEPIISNLYKILKPGGYLQWSEIETTAAWVAKADPSKHAPALDELLAWVMQPKEGVQGADDWKYRLPALLKQNGFDKAQLYQYSDLWRKDLTLLKYYSDQMLMVFEEFNQKIIKDGDAKAQHRDLLNRAAAEASHGAALVFPIIMSIARKGGTGPS